MNDFICNLKGCYFQSKLVLSEPKTSLKSPRFFFYFLPKNVVWSSDFANKCHGGTVPCSKTIVVSQLVSDFRPVHLPQLMKNILNEKNKDFWKNILTLEQNVFTFVNKTNDCFCNSYLKSNICHIEINWYSSKKPSRACNASGSGSIFTFHIYSPENSLVLNIKYMIALLFLEKQIEYSVAVITLAEL